MIATQFPDENVVIFEESECWDIALALNRCDRARQQLIRKQNELVRLLRGMTAIARAEFDLFYARGGVTFQDWQRFIDKSQLPLRYPVARDHIRLVVSNNKS
jgi:hypothetical protein